MKAKPPLTSVDHMYLSTPFHTHTQDAFADWFKQLHANQPNPPQSESGKLAGRQKGFAERLQAEELGKAYEAQLNRWRHEVHLDTEVRCRGRVCYLLLCIR